MPCSISIVPHAPCDSDDEFKYVLAYMLHEDEVPDQVDEALVVDTHIIERKTHGALHLTCVFAIPEEVSTGLGS